MALITALAHRHERAFAQRRAVVLRQIDPICTPRQDCAGDAATVRAGGTTQFVPKAMTDHLPRWHIGRVLDRCAGDVDAHLRSGILRWLALLGVPASPLPPGVVWCRAASETHGTGEHAGNSAQPVALMAGLASSGGQQHA